nr:hypothetical protein [Cryobacterium sp. SO1]
MSSEPPIQRLPIRSGHGDSWSVNLACVEATTGDAFDGRGLPANGYQGSQGKPDSLSIRSGPGQQLGLLEHVLADVD